MREPCDWLMVNIGQLVTNADAAELKSCCLDWPEFDGPKLGPSLSQLGLIENAALAVSGGEVVGVGPAAALAECFAPEQTIDACGRLVTPGLVDCHTHPVFAAARFAEFELRIQGASYEDIARRGGGILNSVNAVRAMSEADLAARARQHFDEFLAHGTTTIEAKSGYGLDAPNELKLLRAIRAASENHPLDVVPTLLALHEVPAEYRSAAARGPINAGGPDSASAGAAAFTEAMIRELLPAAASERLCEAADVYCERGVFSAELAERWLRAAKEHGLAARLHTDQFADIGGTRVARDVGAVSADHLHVTTPLGIQHLLDGEVMPVLLPGAAFFLGGRDTAPAREMIARGMPVALATNFNPGSAPIVSLPIIMSLACLHLRLTPAEALAACTVNPAVVLQRADSIGRLLPSFDADVVVWNLRDFRELPYWFGRNAVAQVYKLGALVVDHDASSAESSRLREA